MSTRDTDLDYPIYAAAAPARGRSQIYRRRRLGMLLIVAGSAWLWLRMIGWVGDGPMLIGWGAGSGALIERFVAGGLAPAVSAAACGMLPLWTIHRAHENDAEQ